MSLLHFGWFLGNGFGPQGWGEPAFATEHDWRRPDLFQDAARYFERCHLDLLVIEDSLVVPDYYRGTAEVLLGEGRFAPKHDPLALTPLLTSVTSLLGVVPTVSAAFSDPFTAARLLATLQHFSQGRLGFNLVTSGSDRAAQNFGFEHHFDHDVRYERADEWLEVVQKLWRSWDPDAIVADPDSGVYADHTRVHPIDHVGRFYSVRGPLNTAPLSDGEPVLVQAGASDRGQKFAGSHAEVVIGLPGSDERMRTYVDGVRRQAVAAGRDASAVKVLFMIAPVVTADSEAAAALQRSRTILTQRQIDSALATISFMAVTDFGRFDLDKPLPPIETNADQSTLAGFVAAAPPGATLREILQTRAGLGGQHVVGTPEVIADELERTAEATGADGFLFTGRVHAAHTHSVLDPLIPVLRRRGILRSEYGAKQLRANLQDF